MGIQYEKHNQYPNHILVRNFYGPVNVHDIIDSWEHLLKNKLITTNIKGVINRLTDCDLKMDFNNFDILITYLKGLEIFKSLKLAVICKDPKTIIFPMLGEHSVKELQIKPFSMEGAAVDWIMESPKKDSNPDKSKLQGK